jgi:hypothetical protein
VPLDPVPPSLTAYPAFDSLEAEAVVVAVAASVEEVVVAEAGWFPRHQPQLEFFKLISFTSKTIPNPPTPSNGPNFISSDQK